MGIPVTFGGQVPHDGCTKRRLPGLHWAMQGRYHNGGLVFDWLLVEEHVAAARCHWRQSHLA